MEGYETEPFTDSESSSSSRDILEDCETEHFTGSGITDEIVTEAAKFFSENYGIWGPLAAEKSGIFAKHGARIKLSPSLLRQKILPSDGKHSYIRLTIPDPNNATTPLLIGNLFSTYYRTSSNQPVIWITQLVVHSEYRDMGVAKNMLTHLKTLLPERINRDPINEENPCVGILSSHPFAILSVLSIFSSRWGMAPSDAYVAKKIMENCPVDYVRDAKLRVQMFDQNDGDGVASCADTGFWVDHREPDDALRILGPNWGLGDLPEGFEFLMII